MRILGLDPGALRLGWAIVSTPWHEPGTFYYERSGIKGLARNDKDTFSAHRWRLMNYWLREFETFLYKQDDSDHRIDLIVSETLPAVGGGNFIAATQAELAKTAITTCQILSIQFEIDWQEIPANTIKKKLTGSGKATKVGVRNAVIKTFPELEPRKKELTTYADESDAIGIALVGAGFQHTP